MKSPIQNQRVLDIRFPQYVKEADSNYHNIDIHTYIYTYMYVFEMYIPNSKVSLVC